MIIADTTAEPLTSLAESMRSRDSGLNIQSAWVRTGKCIIFCIWFLVIWACIWKIGALDQKERAYAPHVANFWLSHCYLTVEVDTQEK